MKLAGGQVLVPRDTPVGPAEAREAWAHELGQTLLVVDVRDGGRTLRVNAPATGETVERATADVVREFEPAAAQVVPPSWAAFLTRCAMEAARVQRRDGEGEEGYWTRVAQAVLRVEVETFPAKAERLEAVG